MSKHVVKLPDVGEGVAEAELVEWHVAVGDAVTPDTVLAEVLTDKATVEIFPPVSGVVAVLHGEPGDTLAVGGALATLETGEAAPAGAGHPPAEEPALTEPRVTGATGARDVPGTPERDAETPVAAGANTPRPFDEKDVWHSPARAGSRHSAAPAVRARARALGIELATVTGSGAEGQVTHADLDRLLTSGISRPLAAPAGDAPRVEPVRGLRRRIAERLTTAWQEIPHITVVDAVDATQLEALRTALNDHRREGQPKLTLLPFIGRAIVLAVAEQPRLNAQYDAPGEALSVFEAVHLGIATQTPDGLTVPVVRHAEARDLHDLAGEIGRLTRAARDGKATRDELAGSTITITSLGALGGLVTTPILNQPEVAIVGINKLETRPVWRDGAFAPREMFNISASFDHRIIDGWDAATFVQRIKELLEAPALLFLDR